jgi:hypothetical protein
MRIFTCSFLLMAAAALAQTPQEDKRLLFSTYQGGDRHDDARSVAVDAGGNIYLAGRASSENFPVKNALQPKMAGGGQDAFIAKFTRDYQLAYATYFGGTGHTDNIYAIAVGPDGSLFVTGETMSPGMATEGAFIARQQSYSSFLAKINPEGSAVTYFTYLGWAGGYTKAQALAVDARGHVVAAGQTNSSDFAGRRALQNYFGGVFDAYLIKLDVDNSEVVYATFWGGSKKDAARAAALGPGEAAVIVGDSDSEDLPVARAAQEKIGSANDSFVMQFCDPWPGVWFGVRERADFRLRPGRDQAGAGGGARLHRVSAEVRGGRDQGERGLGAVRSLG